jgi:hypothetical protein
VPAVPVPDVPVPAVPVPELAPPVPEVVPEGDVVDDAGGGTTVVVEDDDEGGVADVAGGESCRCWHAPTASSTPAAASVTMMRFMTFSWSDSKRRCREQLAGLVPWMRAPSYRAA